MKNSVLTILLMLLISTASFAQLTGVKNIPGDYPTIQSAITALNTSGAGAGGVTFNVAANHSETLLTRTSGYITTLTGTAANPIIFQKVGAGNNPKITAAVGNGLMDAFIAFLGADFITFDGIDLMENPANTTTQTMMEWGFAILKTSPTNGSQNITIKNSTIFLNKTNPNTRGIYSNNHSSTSFTEVPVSNITGTNSNLKISNNTIANSYVGIYVSGFNSTNFPYSFYDQNVEIGKDGGNHITNIGGAMDISYGIYVRRVNNLKVAGNTLTSNTTFEGYATLYGIYLTDANNANLDLYDNTVSIIFSPIDPVGNTLFTGIHSDMGQNGTTNTANIYNNNVTECSLPAASGSTEVKFINLINLGVTVNVYGNTVSDNIVGGRLDANPIGQIRYFWVQKASTTPGPITVHSNNITNNERVQPTPSAGVTFMMGLAGSGTVLNAYNNVIDNNIIATTGGTYGIFFTFNDSQERNLYNNQLTNISEVNGSFNGIYISSGLQSSYIYGNKVQNISSNSTSQYASFNGIYIGQVNSNINVYNNIVGDLNNPAANATLGTSWNMLNGIYIETKPFIRRIYNNTIFLNVTPAGTQSTYGSSAILAEDLYGVDLLNNILINTSGSVGSEGKAAVIRSRSTSIDLFTSNYNNLYAGTPGPTKLIFFNGVTAMQTLANYKAFISPQELQSVTEMSPFVNIATRPYDLHLKTNIPTQCESGGVIITSPFALTTDYDGQPRYPNPGYPTNFFYSPNNPDIGADEFGGVPSDLIPPTITFTPLPNSSNGQPKTLVVGITDGSGVPTSGTGLPRLFWKINNGSYQAVTATWVSDTTYSFTFGGGTVLGDAVYYYFVAQDLANPVNVGATPWQGAAGFSINPPACSTPPTTPYTFSHVLTISGVFHVGVGKDYTTLTAAFNDLNYKFMSGPVTFILDDANYPNETYPLNLFSNPGNSATNNLTIKPKTGVNPKFTGSVASQPLFNFRGLDYVTLDGSDNGTNSRNLTFENTSGTDLVSVISIRSSNTGNPSTNITIKNCIIIGNNTDIIRETYLLVLNYAGGPNGGGYNNIVLENNWLKRAKYGIEVIAAATNMNNNVSVINNTVGSTEPTDFITRWGIAATQTNNLLISGNEVMGPAGGSDGISQYGIIVYEQLTNVKITNNVVHDWVSNGPGSNGIRYDNNNNNTVSEISNNVIYNIGAWGLNPGVAATQAHGIFIRRGGNLKIWHNSIYMSGPYLYGFDSYAPSSSCIAFWSQSVVNSTDYDVRNNVMKNSMTNDYPNPPPDAMGKAYGIMLTTAISGYTFDNNDYFIDGYDGQIAQVYGVGGVSLVSYQRLSDWRAYSGQDMNSVSINPLFTTETNLLPTASALDNLGVYISQVPTDITGAMRSNPPDIGAYEFGVPPVPPVVHNISLPAGWSGVSSYVTPYNPVMNDVLNPILPQLSMLYNYTGIYYPAGGIYTLTNWNDHAGYAVKVNQSVNLPITGSAVTDKTVNLNQGWNLIPVLSSSAYNVVSLFSGITGLDLVKDVAGTGVYWPAFGINSIGNVQPGKAYYVRMNTAGTINYSLPFKYSGSAGTSNSLPTATPWNEVVNTPASHLVAFNVIENSFQSGDVIGGFTAEGWCAGVIEISDPSVPFALNLNSDDIYSAEKDGFETGNPLNYKLFRPSTGETFELVATYNPNLNTGNFENNGLSEITTLKMTTAGITGILQNTLHIYPNPSNGIFNIQSLTDAFNIKVFNAFGDEIYRNEMVKLARIDFSSQPKGLYFVRIENGNEIFFEKLVIN